MAKELVRYYCLNEEYTFKDLLRVFVDPLTIPIEKRLALAIAKVLWGFDVSNYNKSVNVILVKHL